MKGQVIAYGLSAVLAVGLIGVSVSVGRLPVRTKTSLVAKSDGGATASVNANANTSGPIGFAVDARLQEETRHLRVDNPLSSGGAAVMAAHWRKMRLPWTTLDAVARDLTTHIALRTSSNETQWSMPAGTGKAWTPDARVWNMNEGSFDQRESLVAEVPSTLAFTVMIPPGGSFEFAPGSVNDLERAVQFRVSVRDPGTTTGTVISESTFEPQDARRWANEVRVDLAKYGGQSVELVLHVEAVGEAAPRPKKVRPKRADAGAPEPSTRENLLEGRGGVGVALWGNPTIYRRAPLRRNVVWIVIDALRPDVIPSFHDDEADARALAAPMPPLEALLPKVPGLMPHVDALAQRGARFVHAYSAGAWTRPGTLSMLSGARSSELGITALPWVLPAEDVVRFYGSDPPLLPLLLRKQGYATRAFVNNYFMVGYAPVGVDMGFERTDDHRYRTRDTLEITRSAVQWMRGHKDDQFFVFCNFNSPHEPWEPPKEFMSRLPADEPKDKTSRLYMAEAAKDDEAVGALIRTLEDMKVFDRSIVVLTADHGETLSSAHDGVGMDKMRLRYHHAASNYEETSRIPILIVAPGLVPSATIRARVRNVDIAPTIMELLAMEPSARMSGTSLVALARGGNEEQERVVVTEGRGTRAIIAGKYRLLLHDVVVQAPKSDALDAKNVKPRVEELFDLEQDPGERVNLASQMPDMVKEMRARLAAALLNVPVAGSPASLAQASTRAASDAGAGSGGTNLTGPAKVYLRFVGRGGSHRVRGHVLVDAGKTMRLAPVGLGADAFGATQGKVDVAFNTFADAVVGFDITTEPAGAALKWAFFMDDVALTDAQVFAGTYGLRAQSLLGGIVSDEGRKAASAISLPYVDPIHDFGLFVARDASGDVSASSEEVTMEGAEEMNRLLREWGYTRGGK